jgi:hypothetical protein
MPTQYVVVEVLREGFGGGFNAYGPYSAKPDEADLKPRHATSGFEVVELREPPSIR